uniref:Uncharacterized protein n=1 Tax=Glossina palpalis gambiensis TaxID=67801 RepID=A0A1B0BU32_9MUSC
MELERNLEVTIYEKCNLFDKNDLMKKRKAEEEIVLFYDSLRSGGNASVSMPSSSISIPAIFEYLRSFCNLTSVSGGTGFPSITTDDLNISNQFLLNTFPSKNTDDLNISNQFLLNTFPSKNTDVYINLEIIHIPSPYMTRLVFCLLYSTDFTEEEGRGFGRFFGCNEYRRPLRGGRACCSASEALLFSSCGVCFILPANTCSSTKIRTPAKKSATTNKYSASFSGVGVSPIVVNVNVDQ